MWVLVVVTVALQGCMGAPISDGQVLELGIGATTRGIQMAWNGAANTHLISDGKLVFALWPQGEFWGGACINCAVKDPIGQFQYLTGGRGMAMTASSASDLVRDLVDNHGWKSIPAGALTQVEAGISVLSQMSTALTGFLVVPVMVAPTEIIG
jgi:hypothetical protein